jgi:uncharacterized MAPEG superfamily protein
MKVKTKNELLFRKAFIPWYDTEPVMVLTLVFSVAVLLFGMYGVVAAFETPRYRPFVWVPGLLTVLSLVVTVSTLIRMLKRGGHESV